MISSGFFYPLLVPSLWYFAQGENSFGMAKTRDIFLEDSLLNFSQTRSSVPVADELMNSLTEKLFRLLIQ